MQIKGKIIVFLLVLTIFISFISAEPNVTIIPNNYDYGIQDVIINSNYEWNLNSEQIITINTINSQNQSYFPKDIKYKINDQAITIKSVQKTDNEVKLTLSIGQAIVGYNSLNISVIDDRTIEKQVNYKIIKEDNLIKYLVGGGFIGLFLIIILVAINIDR